MTKAVFTIVHPMQNLDEVEQIGNRLEALMVSVYDIMGDLFENVGPLNAAQQAHMRSEIDRGMLLLMMAREYVASSQKAVEIEYQQLAALGLHTMEMAA